MNAFLSAIVLIAAVGFSTGFPSREKREISYPYETCLAKIQNQFKEEATGPLMNWDSPNIINFDEERRLSSAPLSYACFRQCYFEEGKRAGPDGRPSSAAYKKIAEEEKDEADARELSNSKWFADLSKSLAICEEQLNKKTIRNIVLTDIEKAPAGVDTKKCKEALMLDSCMYRYTTEAKFPDDEVIEVMFRDMKLGQRVNVNYETPENTLDSDLAPPTHDVLLPGENPEVNPTEEDKEGEKEGDKEGEKEGDKEEKKDEKVPEVADPED